MIRNRYDLFKDSVVIEKVIMYKIKKITRRVNISNAKSTANIIFKSMNYTYHGTTSIVLNQCKKLGRNDTFH